MRRLSSICLCTWLLVVASGTSPNVIFGQFVTEKSCLETREAWQQQETRPGATWQCLQAQDYVTVAVPKPATP